LCLAGVGLERYLTRRVLPAWLRVGVPLLAVAASTAALVRAERVLPRTEARIYSGDVLVFSGGERQRLALVSHRSYFELYLDRTLKLSGVDAYRYAEVLVHPALAASQRRERVLLLGGGTGVVEREILRWPEVHSLTVVVTDRTLSELARRSPWLRAANAAVLDDPRVQVVEAEPIVWLGRERSLYDAIIADLDDPIGYRQSKHFTRHTFHSIAARLTPGGVGSVQAPSPLTFHAAYASVFSTLRAAGLQTAPYHAPLPTLGEGGFFLFGASSSGALAERASSGGAMLPAGLRFLTAAGMQALFHFSADLKPSLAPDAPANTLHDQPLVELYAREHESR
jgi:spermidine synthase